MDTSLEHMTGSNLTFYKYKMCFIVDVMMNILGLICLTYLWIPSSLKVFRIIVFAIIIITHSIINYNEQNSHKLSSTSFVIVCWAYIKGLAAIF